MLKTALAVVLVALPRPLPRAQDIVVAVAGPMTGQYAAFGEQMKRGAEMAVKDINAKGGVLGKQLQLLIGDDACDPKQAVAVANQMANQRARARRRAFLLRLVDPGLGRLCRERHPADLAGLDQSDAHR